MSFVKSYEQIEAAFEAGQGEEARLRDGLMPHPDLPHPDTVIGQKIERRVGLEVPTRSGSLAVALTCRFVRPDAALCRGVVPLEYFNAMDRQPDPTMLSRQILEWETASGAHSARFVSTFTADGLRSLDQRALPLTYRMINRLPSRQDVHNATRYVAPGAYDHLGTIAAASQTLPAALAHATGPQCPGDGSGVFKEQSAEQFTAQIAWLLESQAQQEY